MVVLSSATLLLLLSLVLLQRRKTLKYNIIWKAKRIKHEALRKKSCEDGGSIHSFGEWTTGLLGISVRWCVYCGTEEMRNENLKLDTG